MRNFHVVAKLQIFVLMFAFYFTGVRVDAAVAEGCMADVGGLVGQAIGYCVDSADSCPSGYSCCPVEFTKTWNDAYSGISSATCVDKQNTIQSFGVNDLKPENLSEGWNIYQGSEAYLQRVWISPPSNGNPASIPDKGPNFNLCAQGEIMYGHGGATILEPVNFKCARSFRGAGGEQRGFCVETKTDPNPDISCVGNGNPKPCCNFDSSSSNDIACKSDPYGSTTNSGSCYKCAGTASGPSAAYSECDEAAGVWCCSPSHNLRCSKDAARRNEELVGGGNILVTYDACTPFPPQECNNKAGNGTFCGDNIECASGKCDFPDNTALKKVCIGKAETDTCTGDQYSCECAATNTNGDPLICLNRHCSTLTCKELEVPCTSNAECCQPNGLPARDCRFLDREGDSEAVPPIRRCAVVEGGLPCVGNDLECTSSESECCDGPAPSYLDYSCQNDPEPLTTAHCKVSDERENCADVTEYVVDSPPTRFSCESLGNCMNLCNTISPPSGCEAVHTCVDDSDCCPGSFQGYICSSDNLCVKGGNQCTGNDCEAQGLRCSGGELIEDSTCLAPPIDDFINNYTGPIIDDLGSLMGGIYRILFPLGLGISLFVILRAGYKYMVSEGDPTNVKEAQEELTSGVLGALFILLSVSMLRIILKQIFGATISF